MSNQVTWTKVILEEFIRIGNLTKEEEAIMRTRCAGWTRTRQAEEFNMSLSTVDRIIRRLKHKYDICQRHSLILPVRKHSEAEDYMDSH